MLQKLKLYGVPALASHIKTLAQAKPRTSASADGARVKNTTGFTIIEVVIVLAIAGLIFAVVFIAVPQLQAAQRDQARQSEMGRLDAAINQYQSNNNGNLPGWAAINHGKVYKSYLNSEFNDPIGGKYTVRRNKSLNWVSYEGARVDYRPGYKCSSGADVTSSGGRSYAVRYELEQGGYQCRDNQ